MVSIRSREGSDIWLCLRLPYLALNCADVRFDSESTVVVLEQQKIVQLNRLAQHVGIKIGHAIEHARMLKPDLKIIDRQIELETEKLQKLSVWAYRYTSHISVYDDHTLLLEIGRSFDFFKGIDAIQNLILADLERLDVDVKYGLAHTPKAAHLLSFGQHKHQYKNWNETDYKTHIEESLLRNLAISDKTFGQLNNCGFHLLKDIRDVSKAQLGARFGKPLIVYLEQLMGDIADPQTLHCTPETFKANIDFAEPISNRAWIQQQIDRLLTDLVTFVNSRQLVCRSLTWHFFNEHGSSEQSRNENSHLTNSVTIGLNINTITLKNLQQLTDLKLSTLALKWAFSSIELSSEDLIPKNLFYQDLFDPTADQEEFNQLIDKLSSRLGNTAIYGLGMADEYLPELANVRNHYASQAASTNRRQAAAQLISKPAAQTNTSQQDEPVWLLRQPQKLRKKHSQPEHHGELKFIHGPNRISSHWWQALQSRDYYIARQNTGRLLWIYYERSQQNWYLHGLYA